MAHRLLAIFRRRLFACLTILSLLLCLATLALWVRSYWRSDRLSRFSSDAQSAQFFGMGSNFGELRLDAHHYPAAWTRLKQGSHFLTRHSSADATFASFARHFPPGQSAHFLGFGFAHLSNPVRGDIYVAPHWFLALLFAALPAARLRSILRIRRQNRVGLCPHCGYDLRASPDRCPECGHARDGVRLALIAKVPQDRGRVDFSKLRAGGEAVVGSRNGDARTHVVNKPGASAWSELAVNGERDS